MNYFAHGMRYIERPYFMAGTAVPDLLSVVDRRVRMRDRNVSPFVTSEPTIQAEVAAGVLQHLNDDHWFHGTRAFAETTTELAIEFRKITGVNDGFRPGFLGHIVTELLLDAILIDREPERLEAYYSAFQELDVREIQSAVNRMAKYKTDKLADMIPLFCRERFLFDYLDPKRLLYRLNQVMRRIKLNQLPSETEHVLQAGWSIVSNRFDELLPQDYFSSPSEKKDTTS